MLFVAQKAIAQYQGTALHAVLEGAFSKMTAQLNENVQVFSLCTVFAFSVATISTRYRRVSALITASSVSRISCLPGQEAGTYRLT